MTADPSFTADSPTWEYRGRCKCVVMEELFSGASHFNLPLNPEQLQQFETYYHELIDWNQRINLTTITGYEDHDTWFARIMFQLEW